MTNERLVRNAALPAKPGENVKDEERVGVCGCTVDDTVNWNTCAGCGHPSHADPCKLPIAMCQEPDCSARPHRLVIESHDFSGPRPSFQGSPRGEDMTRSPSTEAGKRLLASDFDTTGWGPRMVRIHVTKAVLAIEAEARQQAEARVAAIKARRPAYDPANAGAYEHGIEDAYRAVLALLTDPSDR